MRTEGGNSFRGFQGGALLGPQWDSGVGGLRQEKKGGCFREGVGLQNLEIGSR